MIFRFAPPTKISFVALVVCALTCLSSCSKTQAPQVNLQSWNPQSAAAYLDERENWWMHWRRAARDHDTFCVSCHTAVPYAMSRPVLHHYLGETTPTEGERALLENVRKRVRLWKEIAPFYTDQGDGPHKAAESRGTEAVLNALILAGNDQGKSELSEDTRKAFDIMWGEQITKGDSRGAWYWLQFDNEPWEAIDSEYYGAVLAVVAVGLTPASFQSEPQNQTYLEPLKDYLKREYSRQSLLNRTTALWASSRVPGVLTPEQRSSLISELQEKQQSDGGWNIASTAWAWNGWHRASLLGRWKREDGTWQPGASDGYATALIVLTLIDSGVPPDNNCLRGGQAWLLANQDRQRGDWPSYSLNQRFKPSSDFALFMNDAATAYAVLALARSQQQAAGTPQSASRIVP
jgi:squalene-hopene/tetraprenyl-beta-curcumene cyclase